MSYQCLYQDCCRSCRLPHRPPLSFPPLLFLIIIIVVIFIIIIFLILPQSPPCWVSATSVKNCNCQTELLLSIVTLNHWCPSFHTTSTSEKSEQGIATWLTNQWKVQHQHLGGWLSRGFFWLGSWGWTMLPESDDKMVWVGQTITPGPMCNGRKSGRWWKACR